MKKLFLATVFAFLIGAVNAQSVGFAVTPQILTAGNDAEGRAYTIDGYYQLKLGKHFFLRSGIDYEMISEITEFSNWNDRYGDDYTAPESKSVDRYAKIGIPILFGAHLNGYQPRYPKFKYFMYGGYQASIGLPSHSFDYHGSVKTKLEKRNEYDQILEDKLINTFIFGLDFSFDIYENWNIYFAPQFRNTYIDPAHYDNQSSFGLQLGARYQINK